MEKNKGNSRWKAMGKALKMELREHKSSFLVYVILRALVICVMILQIFNRNFENVFLCILTLILLIVPSFIQVNLKIEFPTGLEIILLFFIFAAEILGEIQAYYIKIPEWDTALHTTNGFLMAAIGFSLVDILNRNERFSIKLSPLYVWSGNFLNLPWIGFSVWICRKIRLFILSALLCWIRQEAIILLL